jgi:hypothetical protein
MLLFYANDSHPVVFYDIIIIYLFPSKTQHVAYGVLNE